MSLFTIWQPINLILYVFGRDMSDNWWVKAHKLCSIKLDYRLTRSISKTWWSFSFEFRNCFELCCGFININIYVFIICIRELDTTFMAYKNNCYLGLIFYLLSFRSLHSYKTCILSNFKILFLDNWWYVICVQYDIIQKQMYIFLYKNARLIFSY